MTKSDIKESMLRLSASDRLELLEDLEVSLARDDQRIPLQPWQKEIIEKRMAEYKNDPSNVISSKDFVAKLREAATGLRDAGKTQKN